MNENDECEYGLANKITYLLVGGGIGATLALLFAPKRGRDLRHDIAGATRKGFEATVQTAAAIQNRSADSLRSTKKEVNGSNDPASNKFDYATETAKDVVSGATGSLADGVDRMQNESAPASSKAGNNRKSSNIV